MSRKLFLCFLTILIMTMAPAAFAGKVELTTYYPSAYGEYINLKSTADSYFATASGNVGIGTASPGAKFDVDGNIRQSVTHGNNMCLWLSAARNGAGTGAVGLYSWISEPNATWTGGGIARNMINTAVTFPRVNTGLSGQMIRFDEAATPSIYFHLESSGGSRIVASLNTIGAWTNASDRSFKTEIRDLSKYGLDTVLRMEPREYKMKSSLTPQIGFIAQEMEVIVPEVVSGDEGKKGISYGNLIPVLVNAIKEQQSQIEALKEETAELKTEVAELKKR